MILWRKLSNVKGEFYLFTHVFYTTVIYFVHVCQVNTQDTIVEYYSLCNAGILYNIVVLYNFI